MRNLLFPALHLSRLGYARKAESVAVPILTFLIRDKYTSDDPAPLSNPRIAEPGPGSFTVEVDTGSNLSISGGALNVAAQPALNNPVLWENTNLISRAAGIAFIVKWNGNGASFSLNFGFATAASGTGAAFCTFQGGSLSVIPVSRGFTLGLSRPITNGDDHIGAIVLMAAGGAVYILDGNIIAVDRFSTQDPFSTMAFRSRATTADTTPKLIYEVSVCNLVANGYTDWVDLGICTSQLLGSRSQGDTFTHTADSSPIEFTVTTLPPSGQIEFVFRRQDASNYWQVTVDSSGNLDLDEVVEGVATQRGTSSGVIVSGDRILIYAENDAINIKEHNGSAAAVPTRITYTSASNFQLATVGELLTLPASAVVSDIIAWPTVVPSTAYQAILDALASP